MEVRPLHLNTALVEKLIGVHGNAGREWVAAFPALLRRFRETWNVVELGPPFPYVGYAWVGPGRLADGLEVVLKLAPPGMESTAEIAALKLYDGRGAARLLASDSDAVALLLERLHPGETLATTVGDDTTATGIAAGLAGRLSRPLPADHPFPTIERWGEAFERAAASNPNGPPGVPPELFHPARRIYFDLCRSATAPVLLHGDLHHWNILSATREPWLAIDPKGLTGELAFEAGAYLRNRTDGAADLPAQLRRRAQQFAEALALDSERVLGWGFALSVLSILWSFEDNEPVDAGRMAVAWAFRAMV